MAGDTKQVIVMIHQFPDGKGGAFSPRKGKMIAQGAHASIAFLTRRIEELADGVRRPTEKDGDLDHREYLNLTPAMIEWMRDSFAKVCVRVDSEQELMEIYQKAQDLGLEVHLVKDSGRTEFKEPTITCLAIGPDYSEKIDEVTGHLKLL